MSDHDDLVERLNKAAGYNGATVGERQALLREAAAVIQSLQEEIQELNKLLADGANGRTLAAEARLAECQAEYVSYQQSAEDWDRKRKTAEAEVARLKAELAEGCDLLDRFDGHLPTVRRYLERVRSFRDGQKTGEKG